jgi:VanZ like protein
MLHRLIVATAWACLLFIAFATLVPFHSRPGLTDVETFSSVLVERVGAFGVLGGLFSMSYPRRYGFICGLVFGSAILLEALQIFVPDRDARVMDAIEKLLGGGVGIIGTNWLLSVMPSPILELIRPRD